MHFLFVILSASYSTRKLRNLNSTTRPWLLCICKISIHRWVHKDTVRQLSQDGVKCGRGCISSNAFYLSVTLVNKDRWLSMLLTRLRISAKSAGLSLAKQATVIRKADRYRSFYNKWLSLLTQMAQPPLSLNCALAFTPAHKQPRAGKVF